MELARELPKSDFKRGVIRPIILFKILWEGVLVPHPINTHFKGNCITKICLFEIEIKLSNIGFGKL